MKRLGTPRKVRKPTPIKERFALGLLDWIHVFGSGLVIPRVWCDRFCPDIKQGSARRNWLRTVNKIRDHEIPHEATWTVDPASSTPYGAILGFRLLPEALEVVEEILDDFEFSRTGGRFRREAS